MSALGQKRTFGGAKTKKMRDTRFNQSPRPPERTACIVLSLETIRWWGSKRPESNDNCCRSSRCCPRPETENGIPVYELGLLLPYRRTCAASARLAARLRQTGNANRGFARRVFPSPQ